jgi:thiol-disulfide isomerase/thioredoxin
MLSFRILLVGLILGLVAPACSDKGLGGEPVGQTISSYTGTYNVVVTPVARRKFKPVWSGKDLDGNVISAATLRGSVTVVNFWASWCGPCHAEQPTLEAVWKRYKDRGVRFVGIDIREHIAAARGFIDLYGVTYPSINNFDSGLAYKFRTLFVPSTYVLDRRGYVAARINGATVAASSLTDLLDAELAA